MINLKKIDPLVVTKSVTFQKDDMDWTWKHQRNTMFDKQAEGTAKIWNLLSKYNLALLADEVGMGKTLQAMAVMSLLWKVKPSARILVFAPNQAVTENWATEYRYFIQSHYKESNDIVRTRFGREPVNKPVLVRNLEDLYNTASEGWGHFFIGKTTSFSNLVSREERRSRNEDELTVVKKAGIKLRKKLLKVCPIDLMIIDEAHYFRNRRGESLRVHAAEGFFGNSSAPLADRVLLMTATPNHSSNDNIKNIVSYFNDDLGKMPSDDILNKIAIRRFRVLGDKNKYQYREESDHGYDFGDNILSELFFGLYQRKLAFDVSSKGKENRRYMYGYLEGFESTKFEKRDESQFNENDEPIEEKDDGKTHRDFKETADTQILNGLANDYKKIMHDQFPEHPKYTNVVKGVLGPKDIFSNKRDIHEEKHLIFVRRIPSVREIAARINMEYDLQFIKKIVDAWGDTKTNPQNLLDRGKYIDFTKELTSKKKIQDDLNLEKEANEQELINPSDTWEDLDYFHLNSAVMDLFTVRKKSLAEKYPATHASNFRKRFTVPLSPFSLFFKPAKDYKSEPYTRFYISHKRDKERDYPASADWERLMTGKRDENHFIFGTLHGYGLEGNSPDTGEACDTLWGIFYDYLNECNQTSVKEKLDGLSIPEKEALANYLYKGILFASSCLIELYCWFISIQHLPTREQFREFTAKVRTNFSESRLPGILIKAVINFSNFRQKILGLSTTNDMIKFNWNFLNNQNPAYPVSGATQNRSRLIQSFNSPFFPNVLVATSVLQEGVNLQFHCKKVMHYGIAWTPGDNEQRVGRIDRMFGLVERGLMSGNDSRLHIQYPYLEKTLDEYQVGSFIRKKHNAEKTLDMCRMHEIDKEIDETENIDDWKNYLLKPKPDYKVPEPYPAKFPELVKQSELPKFQKACDSLGLINRIRNDLHHLIKDKTDEYNVFTLDTDTGKSGNIIALLDSKTRNKRHQPVVVEINYSSEFSGLVDGTIYYLTFKTPLSHDTSSEMIDSIEKSYNKLKRSFPLVQLAKDHQGGNNSFFNIYMRTDLPLFIDENKSGYLSLSEMQMMYKQITECADNIEIEVLKDQDLTFDDIEMEKRHITEAQPDIKALDKFRKNICKSPGLWKHDNKHNVFVLESNLNRKRYISSSIIWELNSRYPFISINEKGDNLVVKLPYPDTDFQDEERELLEKWFNYVKIDLIRQGYGQIP